MSNLAVLETGGKQYKVSVGDMITIEKMPGEHKEGEKISFDKVLLLDDGNKTTIGSPYLEGKSVSGELKKIGRAKKIDVVHFKSKSRHFKRYGHRQHNFKVCITDIA